MDKNFIYCNDLTVNFKEKRKKKESLLHYRTKSNAFTQYRAIDCVNIKLDSTFLEHLK